MGKKSSTLSAKELGKRIAEKRGDAGITQEQVAERLEIGLEAVSRMERGVSIPNAIRLVELAEIFDCRTDDLLHSSSHRPSDQAAYLEGILASTDQKDRQFIVKMVEMYVEHVKETKRKQ